MKNKLLATIIAILSIISVGIFSFLLISNKLLPFNYQVAVVLILIVLILLAIFLALRKNSILKLIGVLICAIVIATTVLGSIYINKSISSLEKVSVSDSVKTTKMKLSLIKLKSTRLEELEQKANISTEMVQKEDRNKVDELLAEIDSKINEKLRITQADSYMSAAKNLVTKKADLMVFNEAYRSVIKDFIPEFDDITEVISTKEFTKQSNIKQNVEDKDSFNLYISGIDTYGPIDTVSRSDVNLVVSVNQTTRKILITTIPRDTYVPIAGGGNNQKDKLTHSGIYGIDSSVDTLENFLDIDIDYYAKVNFNTLIELVDVLGGVDVENVQTFSAGGYNFPKGTVHLDGKKALVFSRERYHLSDGDHDRGRNQERVLKAIIEKASNPNILLKSSEILSIVEKAAQTNMSKDFMIKIANKELESKNRYEIKSQDLKGEGKMGLPSYAMPGYRLYMMVPYEDSLNEIKANIKATLNENN